MKRAIEFFENDEGGLSMTRLLCFMAFFPATYVLVIMPSEGMLGWYLGAFVGGYVTGKGVDMIKGRSNDIPVE